MAAGGVVAPIQKEDTLNSVPKVTTNTCDTVFGQLVTLSYGGGKLASMSGGCGERFGSPTGALVDVTDRCY